MRNRGQQLQKFLDEYNPNFDWGSNHCVCFVSAWVSLIEGESPAPLLPKFENKTAAYRYILQYGASLREAVITLSARPSSYIRYACVGDVVMSDSDGVQALGICGGRLSTFLSESGGYTHVETYKLACCWRVG